MRCPETQLENIQDDFAFPEAIQENRHRRQIKSMGTQPYQVRSDALQLSEQNPDHLGAGWHVEHSQSFDRMQ